uniref:Uncharacterized protein n=1 Tax=Rhizophora mucronata TaxID=61149 RepID=A0A2P2NE61_RHIMU
MYSLSIWMLPRLENCLNSPLLFSCDMIEANCL